jgi:hypothetical protein
MSSDLVKFVFQNTVLAILIVTSLLAFSFFREYLRFRIRTQQIAMGTRVAEDEAEEADTETDNKVPGPSDQKLDDPKHVVNSNFKLLERYYDQTLVEYRLNFRTTAVIASLGFVAILIGIGIAYSGTIAVGVVSGAAGVVAEAATILFFRQNQEQVKQVQEYHKKLVSTQYLLTAISLADSLQGQLREDEVKRIILNLLYLSNELHGSKSAHLLSQSVAAVEGNAPYDPFRT